MFSYLLYFLCDCFYILLIFLLLVHYFLSVYLRVGLVDFQFNNKFYRQIFGSAMGNPISPILSDTSVNLHATRAYVLPS